MILYVYLYIHVVLICRVKSSDLQTSNSEQTPPICELNNDSTSLERNIEGDNAMIESSAKEHDEDRAAFYEGDDDEDVLDHYSYRRHDHKDDSDKLLKISGDLEEVPEEDEAFDDFLEARCVDNCD